MKCLIEDCSKNSQQATPNHSIKLDLKYQSAFISSKAISDSVLITHEILQYIRLSKASKKGSIAVKTYMSGL